jgi:hypothetical protein
MKTDQNIALRLFIFFIALLLLFNGAGAIYGGLSLIIHPDGSGLQLSLEFLKHSPFTDYLIPGIVLFIANGLLSFFVLGALLFNYKHYPLLVILQGTVLCGWILIQIIIVQMIYYLHFVMGGTGILLIICGFILLKLKTKKI